MINLANKHDCCGCSACVQRCPKHCISLEEDSEGFLYPKVNIEKCIDCGLCEKVCPWQNSLERILPMEVLAVKNRNEAERMASSSGGVFIALAKEVLSKEGVVFGAVFDENWEVKHTYAETLEGIKPMMGSKYLQSRIGNSYCEAEKFLKEGREVLFTGTPCQIAGLHKFLGKNYSNLLSVDILCHGVPSQGVWRKYLSETCHRMISTVNSKQDIGTFSSPIITDIEFRNKELKGWNQYCFVIKGKSAITDDKSTILYSNIHHINLYMRGFLANVYLRPSCHNCKCKNGASCSDLTIGDYWGIKSIMPDFSDDKGIGLVLINTEKGNNIFNCLDMESRRSNLENAKSMNDGFKEYVLPHPKRNSFFTCLHHGDNMEDALRKTLYVIVYKRLWIGVKNKLKRTLQIKK